MIRTTKFAIASLALISTISSAYAYGYSSQQGGYMQGQPSAGAYQTYPQTYPQPQGDLYSTPSYPAQGSYNQAPIQQQYEVYDGRVNRPAYNWGGEGQYDQRRDIQNQPLERQNQRGMQNQRMDMPETRQNQPQQFRSGERRMLADMDQPMQQSDNRQMLNQRQQMNPRDKDMDSSTNDDAYKLRRALQNDQSLSINARNIRVSLSSDNELILTGTVKDESEKKQIEAIAKRTTGNQNIINKLQTAGY